jgi:predicted HAD superfamily Cof-like phosphohydrolase
MRQILKDVDRFMDAVGDERPKVPKLPPVSVRDLRMMLLKEEFEEYMEAEHNDDIVEIADALADLVYIVAGTALKYGIPLAEIFEEVHATNMAKFPDGKVTIRKDGKILKPVGWQPPDIPRLLREAGYESSWGALAPDLR